jgi:hypothetical protein
VEFHLGESFPPVGFIVTNLEADSRAVDVIAFHLGNLWRGVPLGPVLPLRVGNWSLTSFEQRLLKTGGGLVRPACYYGLLLAEGYFGMDPCGHCGSPGAPKAVLRG